MSTLFTADLVRAVRDFLVEQPDTRFLKRVEIWLGVPGASAPQIRDAVAKLERAGELQVVNDRGHEAYRLKIKALPPARAKETQP